MKTFGFQKNNCPNCWGHQEYGQQSKSAKDLAKKWVSQCIHTIGWIQQHVKRYLTAQ